MTIIAYKIYVRQRLKVGSGVKEPQFRVVALSKPTRNEHSLEISAIHFRKVELEQIAEDVGAEIVYLTTAGEEKKGKMKL